MTPLDVHINYRIVETVDAILTIKGRYPEFYGLVFYTENNPVFYTDNNTIIYTVFSFEWKDKKIKFDVKYYNTSNRQTSGTTLISIVQNIYTRLTL